jgi:hypothetical protein
VQRQVWQDVCGETVSEQDRYDTLAKGIHVAMVAGVFVLALVAGIVGANL